MNDRFLYGYEFLVPASMEFISALNRFHNGQITDDVFVDIIEERNRVTEQARNEFLNKVPISEHPAAGARQRNCIKVLNQALDEITELIPKLIEYGEDKTEDKYRLLLANLGRICVMERRAIEQYELANHLVGPTNMPMVNAVFNARKRYYAKEISEETYHFSIDKIVDTLQQAYNELDERKDDNPEMKSDLLYAYNRFMISLENLKASSSEDENYSASLMKDVIDAANEVVTGIKLHSMSVFTKGPTRIYQANYIYNMAKSWQDGRLEAKDFLGMLDIFAEHLDRTLRNMQALSSLPSDRDQEIADNMEVMQEGFVEQFRAVELFRSGVAGDAAAVDEAFSVLVEGAEKAADASEAFAAMGDSVGKVPCMQCGTLNPSGNRKCTNCGARLLNSDPMGMTENSSISFNESGGVGNSNEELKMTPELGKMFTSIDSVMEGYIDKEHFAEEIDTYRRYVNTTFNPDVLSNYMLHAYNDPNGNLPQRVEEICEELRTALQVIMESLDAFDLYVGDSDTHHIVDGVMELKDGNIKLQHIYKKMKALSEGRDPEELTPYAGFGVIMSDDEDMNILG